MKLIKAQSYRVRMMTQIRQNVVYLNVRLYTHLHIRGCQSCPKNYLTLNFCFAKLG